VAVIVGGGGKTGFSLHHAPPRQTSPPPPPLTYTSQLITLWYYRVPLRHDRRAPVNAHALHRYSGKSKCRRRRRRTGKPDRSAAAAEWGRHPTLAAPLRARVCTIILLS